MKQKVKYFLLILVLSMFSSINIFASDFNSNSSKSNAILNTDAHINNTVMNSTVTNSPVTNSPVTNSPVTNNTVTNNTVIYDTVRVGKLSLDSYYRNYDYVIDSYDVNIDVNEDNTFNIKEKIGAYFLVPKHGIYRTIPLTNKIHREDGTSSSNRTRITDITVDAPYTAAISDGNKVIKIGDADYTLTGTKEYNISYTYNLGKDTGKDYDELYYNIIGSEWDTAIGSITFTINMPKEFDATRLGFTGGEVGSTDSSNITYKVVGNTITGSYRGNLESGQALTVRLELPDGYFTSASSNVNALMILPIIIPLLFVLITFIMWYKFGKDNKVVDTVEFYPPAGYNSAEVGFLYKGKADKNDAISLLIYLANKGYLKITDSQDQDVHSKTKGFKFTKLKEYNGKNENEKMFLTGLFKSSAVSSVTASDLKDTFYITLNKIIADLNKKVNRQEVFEKSSLGKGIFLIIMIMITYILITVKPVSEYGGWEMMPFALLFPGIGFSVLFGTVFGKTAIPVKIFGLIWGSGFGGSIWVLIVLPALLVEPIYLIAYIIGLACTVIIIIFFKLMPKRTFFGNEILGKINGFKTFLETAEKPKLEALVMENPEYFYNILPYTYVLGISDKWIKKFEIIALEAPSWYDGTSAFNMGTFGTFMNSTMSSASSAMSSNPSSSGSGGGSSGGGSGGGGGGSW